MFAALVVCGCGANKGHKIIAPLPCSYEIGALTDCMVPAQFTSDDFHWMGGNLTMTVFRENIYDAVDLHLMSAGDTLQYDGHQIIVETIDNENGVIAVNGGLENGGAWFQAGDGGTYRAFQFDNHSVFTELGTVELPLSEDFIIIDCGVNPTDLSDTVRADQKLYLETLEGWRGEFSPLNTKVLVENGLITQIARRWIP